MILPDVNVLIYAFRSDSSRHSEYKEWLENAVDGSEAYGISPQVLASFLRICTHPRIFLRPSELETALAFCRALLERPNATVITPRIVGRSVGLAPLEVIITMMAAGSLFGFLGVLLAVPLGAAAKILIQRGVQAYLASEFYSRGPKPELSVAMPAPRRTPAPMMAVRAPLATQGTPISGAATSSASAATKTPVTAKAAPK